jgi:hypothetical protein
LWWVAEDAERLETGEERCSSLQKGGSLWKQISRAVAELAGMTERLPFVGQCPMMELERVRTVLGCRNPDRRMGAFERTEYSLDLLASGSLWRMSRPLKLKAIGACLSAFELPDLGLLGLFAGTHRRRFLPSQDTRSRA